MKIIRNKTATAIIAALLVLVCGTGTFVTYNCIVPEKAHASEVYCNAVYNGSSTVSGDTEKIWKKAKKVTSLKKMGVKFDLKKNKTIKLKSSYDSITWKDPINMEGGKSAYIKQPWTAKITNYKMKRVKNKKYKQVTFTVQWNSNWKPTKKQVASIMNCDIDMTPVSHFFGNFYSCFVDNKTGENLEAKNNHGVKIKCKNSKRKMTKFVGTGKSWIKVTTRLTQKYTITFPSNYKNLCFGVGGTVVTYTRDDSQANADNEFFKFSDKKHPYTGTSFFKKGKKNFHFMQIK